MMIKLTTDQLYDCICPGCGDVYLHIRHPAVEPGGDGAGPEPGRSARLPVPHQRRAQAHTREKMVRCWGVAVL